MKTTITENSSNWSHGTQLCLTQWNYEPCHVGPAKKDSSWWRVLTKHGPLEKEIANHFNTLAFRAPWTQKVWKYETQKDRTLKDELSKSVGAQYATGEQWRNNSRKNEEMEPKQKQHPVVDVTGDGSKVWSCKEQFFIWTRKFRSMNQANRKWSNRRWQGWTSTF